MPIERLLDIMQKLREGCPWDRKQTPESLKPYIVEEAYELLEAIDSGQPANVREELGDLLLQIVFQSQLYKERGEFDMEDVIEGISDKMVSRHPHVFGDGHCATAEEVAGQWEERKKEEGKMRQSILEGVPEAMPALLRAQRLSSRAAKTGFDWQHMHEVLDKLEEEMAEFREALELKDTAKVEEEMGDILFVLANVSRFAGISAEDALRKTIAKFIKRFRHIEMAASAEGRELRELGMEQMEALWQQAKGLEEK